MNESQLLPAGSDSHFNRATSTITAILGITLAVAGMHHGFFEILQGNTPTESLVIRSIGPSHQMWEHGTDEAFTLIPNFLMTGIASVVVSLLIVLGSLFLVRGGRSSPERLVPGSGFLIRGWSFRVLRKRWTTFFLLLFILLTLVGGGIGHIIFFFTAWAYATRMNKPLKWWRKILSGSFWKTIAAGWIYSVSFAALCFIIGLEISVFGYVPGISNPDSILVVCWGFLLLGLIFINVSYITGFGYDIRNQAQAAV